MSSTGNTSSTADTSTTVKTSVSRPSDIPAPGFTDAIGESQLVFRALQGALAHPTRSYPLRPTSHAQQALGPEALGSGLASVALTVLDQDTPLALCGPLMSPEVRAWLTFHTGAPVRPVSEAAFVFLTPQDLPPQSSVRLGTDEEPHLSATLVIDTRAADSPAPGKERTSKFIARGPGIKDASTVELPWTPEDFLPVWNHNADQFPRGVDLLLVDETSVRALPRTTRLTSAPSLPSSMPNSSSLPNSSTPVEA